jgi:RecG-like helicase
LRQTTTATAIRPRRLPASYTAHGRVSRTCRTSGSGSWSNRRVLVTGEAGIGKTLLAREAAVRSAATGKRVWLLCFTEALARWLAEGLRDSGVKVNALYPYAAEILTRAGTKGERRKGRGASDIAPWGGTAASR